MEQHINEIRRMQQIAGIITEASHINSKEDMGNFKEVPANDKVSGKSIVTDGRNYYVYKTSIGASNNNTALFVYDMDGNELNRYDLVDDKAAIAMNGKLQAAVKALENISGLGLK